MKHLIIFSFLIIYLNNSVFAQEENTIPEVLSMHNWQENFSGICMTSDDASILRIDRVGDTLIGRMITYYLVGTEEREVVIYLMCDEGYEGSELVYHGWMQGENEILKSIGVLSTDFEFYTIIGEKQFERMDCN